jgi:L-erythro-3,5-diaminohexanoate dehydrogenase
MTRKRQELVNLSDLEIYGHHRVVKPKRLLPQTAQKLKSTPKIISQHELLLRVDTLMLDSSSMRQLREKYSEKQIPKKIMEIVQTRGKMHNPVTNSGGVLIGTVSEVGKDFFKARRKDSDNLVGKRIVPVASLTTLPLHLDQVHSIKGDSVSVSGSAIAFSCMPIWSIPDDFSDHLALACLDISSLVPQLRRTFENLSTNRRQLRVLVIGCGKAGIVALYLLKQMRRTMPSLNLEVLAFDSSAEAAKYVAKKKLAQNIAVGDAKNPLSTYQFITQNGGPCDLVINVVNSPDTETATLICTKDAAEGGTILWFSMATKFDQAALATDGLGKDAIMLIGNGVAQGQVSQIVALVQEFPELRQFLEGAL